MCASWSQCRVQKGVKCCRTMRRVAYSTAACAESWCKPTHLVSLSFWVKREEKCLMHNEILSGLNDLPLRFLPLDRSTILPLYCSAETHKVTWIIQWLGCLLGIVFGRQGCFFIIKAVQINETLGGLTNVFFRYPTMTIRTLKGVCHMALRPPKVYNHVSIIWTCRYFKCTECCAWGGLDGSVGSVPLIYTE